MERPRAFLKWAVETFGPIALDRKERAMRFVEEAVELAQAEGVEQELMDDIVARVYGRERGDYRKEIGQCQATLETLSENVGIDPQVEAEAEFTRAKAKPRDHWRQRHQAKVDLGIARWEA